MKVCSSTRASPFEEQGGEIVDSFTYDPAAPNFGAEVDRVVSGNPDALVLIGFEESAQILTTLFEAGFTADREGASTWSTATSATPSASSCRAGSLVGVKGTLPAAEITDDFRDRLLEVDPELIDFSYGPETYDAIDHRGARRGARRDRRSGGDRRRHQRRHP